MACVHPRPIRNPNTGEVYLVPCGKCIECRRAYQNEWIFRLSEEMKHSPVPLFITLTYNDENLPLGDNGNVTQSVLVKSDIQLFLKRLRKDGGLGKFRYFAVGEYGAKFNRAHYHLVLMPRDRVPVINAARLIDSKWSKGFVKVKFCTPKQVHYVCKYMNKLDDRKHLVKPFRLYSKSLGLEFLSVQMIKYYLTTFSRTAKNGSCNIPLPRYFRRKLDAICECHPFMKKAGVKYSELINEVNPVVPEVGSRYWFFREFQRKLQRLSDTQLELQSRGLWLDIGSLRHIFDLMYKDVPELVNLDAQSQRLISDCKIRNGLVKSRPPVSIQPNINFLILQE